MKILEIRKTLFVSFLLISISLIHGCASLGHKPKNPDLDFNPAPKAKDGMLNFYLVRTYAQPTMYPMAVYVDGKKIAELDNFTYTWLPVEPGKHSVEATWPGGTSKPDLKFEVEIDDEKFIGFGGVYTYSFIYVTANSQAYEIPKEKVFKALKGHERISPLD